ncbi:MAG: Vacuolar protein sorting-associated protein 62 [Candelina mexicana]|nr:MAG: Vacuolar protein sorting-associated protein 62 [Candelina mexicana]
MRFAPKTPGPRRPWSSMLLNLMTGESQIWVSTCILAVVFFSVITLVARQPPGHGGQPSIHSTSPSTIPKAFVHSISLSRSKILTKPANRNPASTYLETSELGDSSGQEIPHLHSSERDSDDTATALTNVVQVSSLFSNVAGFFHSMVAARRVLLAAISTFIGYLTLAQLSSSLRPNSSWISDEEREETHWVASSHSWLDRTACDWLGMCGVAHFRSVTSELRIGREKKRKEQVTMKDASGNDSSRPWQSAWTAGKSKPEEWADDERALREIPQFVLDYAPLVHLYSGEQFWPCDLEEHLVHTTPYLNYTPVQARSLHPNLTDLDGLNQWNRGRFVYLQSDDDVEKRPDWLGGEKNIPSVPKNASNDSADQESWAEWDGRLDGEVPEDTEKGSERWIDVGEGSTWDLGGWRPNPSVPNAPIPAKIDEGESLVGGANQHKRKRSPGKRIRGGKSEAPAILIIVNKGHGIVDAFWFYFYSFNLGNIVFNVRFGNHVGDWEHSLVRFQYGVPKAVYFSEHDFGSAYSYEAVEKIGKRPVIYSATGTHAMYATSGRHTYILPFGLLHDQTDRGPLWDPLLNAHTYTYDYLSDTLRSSNITPLAPTNWFYFAGHWGDKFYPLNDKRQYRFAGQYHYVNGPLGPRFKNLGRKKVCQNNDVCIIKNWIGGLSRARRWKGIGEGDEMSEEDVKRYLPPIP